MADTMQNQRCLFDVPVRSVHPRELARRDGPETSKEAAVRFVALGKHARHEKAAFDLVNSHPGRTGYELDRIGKAQSREVSRRLGGLERRGFIKSGPARWCQVAGSKCKTWWPVRNGRCSDVV